MAWWQPAFWSKSKGTDERSLENPSTSLSDPDQWLLDLFSGGPTLSGVPVSEETALTHAAVFACNRVLAESIASLPVGLFRRLANGDVEPADAEPEHTLISRTPSENYTSYTFRSTMQLHLGLKGNAFAIIRRNARFRARELRILRTGESIRPFWHSDKLYYEFVTDGKRQVLDPSDVLHVASMSTDGVNGRSPITVLRETIGMGLAATQFAASAYANGGRVPMVLSMPGKVTPEQVKQLQDGWKKMAGGATRAGIPPVLQHDLKPYEIGMNLADAQFISAAKLTTQDIYRAYRIPAHMVGDLERATFSNIEQQSLEFVQYTILPWIKNWEQELNRKLIPVSQQGEYFYRFNLEGLLRADFKTRWDSYTKAIQWGILNRDEVRGLENLNRIPDGLGEVYLTPLNMQPLTDEALQAQAAQEGQAQTDQNTNTQENEGE